MIQNTVAPEHALVFQCAHSRLVAVLSSGPRTRAVLVVVGGPQYRAGSHRQFVQLARMLSASGFPVLRFDYRGLGDSEGELRGFEFISDDIRAAVDTLCDRQPQVTDVVLWGLCDAASASILYAPSDSRVAGVVMVNPWVRSAQTEARTYLRHYYLQRILSPEFWRKMLRGRLDPRASLQSLVAFTRAASSRSGSKRVSPTESAPAVRWSGGPLPTLPGLSDRMVRALEAFRGQVLIVTSGEDLTAAEFLDVTRASTAWRRLLADARVSAQHLPGANHTFSQAAHKRQVETWTCDWLQTW